MTKEDNKKKKKKTTIYKINSVQIIKKKKMSNYQYDIKTILVHKSMECRIKTIQLKLELWY